jgi:hypothetical protein
MASSKVRVVAHDHRTHDAPIEVEEGFEAIPVESVLRISYAMLCCAVLCCAVLWMAPCEGMWWMWKTLCLALCVCVCLRACLPACLAVSRCLSLASLIH